MGNRDRKLSGSLWGSEPTVCSKEEILPQTRWEVSPRLSSDLHMCVLVFIFMNVHIHTHTYVIKRKNITVVPKPMPKL